MSPGYDRMHLKFNGKLVTFDSCPVFCSHTALHNTKEIPFAQTLLPNRRAVTTTTATTTTATKPTLYLCLGLFLKKCIGPKRGFRFQNRKIGKRIESKFFGFQRMLHQLNICQLLGPLFCSIIIAQVQLFSFHLFTFQ